MRLLTLLMLFFALPILAQDLGSKTFSIPAVPKPKETTPSPSPSPTVKTPSIFDESPKLPGSIKYEPKLSMGKSSEFANPGSRVAEDLNKKDFRDPHLRSKRDQYFGEFKTKSKKIIISCRDTGMIDGDMVSIKINDIVIRQSIVLEGEFRNFEVDLQKYSNVIVFEALNEGMESPNTAAFIISDEEGNHIYTNSWDIGTGYKASLNIFRN